MKHQSFAYWTLALFFTTLAVFTAPKAKAEDGVPTKIIITDGQPGVALFDNPKESFALTYDFYKLWERVRPIQAVTPAEYSAALAEFPVRADLGAGYSIQAFQAAGEPGCLVVKWREGKVVRYYVNAPEFVSAVGLKDLAVITKDDLHSRAETRGRDFRIVAPPETTAPQWCVVIYQDTNNPAVGPFRNTIRRFTITASDLKSAKAIASREAAQTRGATGCDVGEGACR